MFMLHQVEVVKVEPEKILSRLVVIALTVFLTMVALMGALVARQHWLQQRLVALSDDVQVNLENLEETTEEFQRELSEMRATPGQVEANENWEEITETLEDVDESLNSLGEELSEVAQALDPQSEGVTESRAVEAGQTAVHDPVDQVFTIFAVLVAVSSIFIALLLAIAVRVQERNGNRAVH